MSHMFSRRCSAVPCCSSCSEEIWGWSYGGLQRGAKLPSRYQAVQTGLPWFDWATPRHRGKPELSKEENPVCGSQPNDTGSHKSISINLSIARLRLHRYFRPWSHSQAGYMFRSLQGRPDCKIRLGCSQPFAACRFGQPEGQRTGLDWQRRHLLATWTTVEL